MAATEFLTHLVDKTKTDMKENVNPLPANLVINHRRSGHRV
jgi:hypothetical protein